MRVPHNVTGTRTSPRRGADVPLYQPLKKQKPYAGVVIRRDPASYQLPSIVETWLCRSCRQWTVGAHLVGRCNWCQQPRPR